METYLKEIELAEEIDFLNQDELKEFEISELELAYLEEEVSKTKPKRKPKKAKRNDSTKQKLAKLARKYRG